MCDWAFNWSPSLVLGVENLSSLFSLGGMLKSDAFIATIMPAISSPHLTRLVYSYQHIDPHAH
jgi:hypothetical protein